MTSFKNFIHACHLLSLYFINIGPCLERQRVIKLLRLFSCAVLSVFHGEEDWKLEREGKIERERELQ